MEEEPKKDAGISGRLSLIDFSCEDDSLLFSSSADHPQNMHSSECPEVMPFSKHIVGFSENCNGHGFQVSEAESSQEVNNIVDSRNENDENEEAHVLMEPSEPTNVRKAGKCNLRKSLAWDSAFFTSEGILDPDELEVVNKTFKKSPAPALPGIQEDIRKSAESISTLDSDASALESLEVELFDHIRASIQKSGNERRNAPHAASSGIKTGQGVPDVPCNKGPQAELASRNRMKIASKPVVASKRQGPNKQVPEKNSNDVLVHSRGIIKKGDQDSNLKPPKILPRVIPSTATKKMLAASPCVKIKNDTANDSCNGNNQKPASLSKKPLLCAAARGAPNSVSSPKSSLSSSVSSCSTKTLPTTPCSSQNRSGSMPSHSTAKSATKTLKNRTDSRNANLCSADSTTKTPLRISKNKTESRNSRLSEYLKSTPKSSSSISPASSIDGLSSESSSSTCTPSQRSNSSKASVDISSTSSTCGGDIIVMDAHQPPDQLSVGHEDSITVSSHQFAEKASLKTASFSHPVAAVNAPRSCTNSSIQFKPSGLRMPSPKIGFFDAEKPGVLRTSNVGVRPQFGLRNGLPRSGLPRNGSGNLDEVIKPNPSIRPLMQIDTMKFNFHPTGPSHQSSDSSPRHTSTQQHQRQQNPSLELSGTLRTKNSAGDSKSNEELTAKKPCDKALIHPFVDKGIRAPSVVAHLDPLAEFALENCNAKSLNEEHVLMNQKENISANSCNSSTVSHQLASSLGDTQTLAESNI